MNLLFISRRWGSKSIDLQSPKIVINLMLLAGILCFGLVSVGFLLGQQIRHESATMANWATTLEEDRRNIQRISEQTTDDLNALALNLGQMEARSLRLDALGSRLAEIAGLDEAEFNFAGEPAQGGPIDAGQASSHLPDLMGRFTELQRQIDDRQHKFQLLESIMMDRELIQQALPTGKPVVKGWLSSRYGYRTDPFTGKRSWHAGVDFAGKSGSDVVAVASGVVTRSGFKSGFGRLVEISHGNGYVTRYAHNSANLVEVGDAVEKGEAIAKMGSSGRSTGPHVHFEVLRDGKVVNPLKYIRRVAAE